VDVLRWRHDFKRENIFCQWNWKNDAVFGLAELEGSGDVPGQAFMAKADERPELHCSVARSPDSPRSDFLSFDYKDFPNPISQQSKDG